MHAEMFMGKICDSCFNKLKQKKAEEINKWKQIGKMSIIIKTG